MQSISNPLTGKALSRNTNIWVGFILRALRVLRVGGVFGFVLPASWEYADYAEELRTWMPRQFRDFYTFRSRTPLFEGVSEGSVVVIGLGYQVQHVGARSIECEDRTELCSMLKLLASGKLRAKMDLRKGGAEAGSAKLGDYLEVRLGAVTGDARYFVLTNEERLKLSIPAAACVPVVSKVRHLQCPIIRRQEWEALRRSGEKVWLFRPHGRSLEDPAVQAYLQLKVSRGGCDRRRTKIRQRDPWYATPLPVNVDGFITGMRGAGPKIVFSAMPRLSATNTLYVVTFKPDLDMQTRFGLATLISSDHMQPIIRATQRRYAGGLRKLEPGDLMDMALPYPVGTATEDEYKAEFFARA